MTKIVDLQAKKLKRDHHVNGEARCLHCGYEWQDVAPVSTYYLDCPSCDLHKGVWIGGMLPDESKPLWHCKCGSAFFYNIPAGWRCCGCGAEPIF